MGRVFSLRWAMVGCVFLLGACGGPKSARELSPGNPPETVSPPGQLDAGSGPYAALPPFVDGALRCGLVEEGPRAGTRGPGPAHLRALDPARSTSVPCSAPGPWCVVFGPSERDLAQHQSRAEMADLRARAERASELEERMRSAELLAERERHLRLEQLRHLQTGAEQTVYLTNDDSMSLASPQRLIWAIDHEEPLPAAHVRPHELLNYFSFRTLPVNPDEVFSVLPEISQHPTRPSDLTLSLAVRGQAVDKVTRRSLGLTYVVDRSGSMAGQGRMDFVKRGLLRSLEELKAGDVVQIVLFDSVTCPLVQNFVVGRDSLTRLSQLISLIEPRGGSNLQDGLARGYDVANRAYRPDASNRVVLLTDAEATSLITDEAVIALSARQYDARRVRLSAVGVGVTVSDRLLDRLTEAGKGASVFLSSEAELDAVFGTRFTSLVETIATNVHFRLELPPAMHLRAFYGEEASPTKQRVQAMHFFSGTEQMYLANLEKARPLAATDSIRLSIEFDDPDSGEPRVSEFSWRADELALATGDKSRFAARNLNKARMVATFGYQLRYMAETFADQESFEERKPTISVIESKDAVSPRRLEAITHCRRVKGRLDAFAAQLEGEREAIRIVDLWHRYCDRFGPIDETRYDVAALSLDADDRLVKLEKDLFEPLGGRTNEFPPHLADF